MLNRFYCARIRDVKVDSGRWTLDISQCKTNARDTHIMTAVTIYTDDGHIL